MRGEHVRERAGCDDDTNALTGHLRGRRSSAGCGGRRCCSNVLRELASFIWDHPTQTASCSSEYHDNAACCCRLL